MPLKAQTNNYTNPVVLPVAADPSIIRTPEGIFYLYATQDDWGDGYGRHYLPIFKSMDLIHWDFAGDVFNALPAWGEEHYDLWAPDISYYEGRYYLYYSLSRWDAENSCIGLATATVPEGPWKDLGKPVFCSKDIGVKNSIDPFVWYEAGQRTMVWGSFNNIYAVDLSDDGSKPEGDIVQLADASFEGPYIIKRNGFYYLFVSSGSCCEGVASTYSTWVGRSEKLLGPYLDASGRDLRFGGGEVIMYRNESWLGPGHNSIIRDDIGNDWIVYHAIPANNPTLGNDVNRRQALIDKIVWVEGWPIINGGTGPSFEPQAVPVIKSPGE
jgi:arabinan endo-1,5-alpha-L-arabinosidase